MANGKTWFNNKQDALYASSGGSLGDSAKASRTAIANLCVVGDVAHQFASGKLSFLVFDKIRQFVIFGDLC